MGRQMIIIIDGLRYLETFKAGKRREYPFKEVYDHWLGSFSYDGHSHAIWTRMTELFSEQFPRAQIIRYNKYLMIGFYDLEDEAEFVLKSDSIELHIS